MRFFIARMRLTIHSKPHCTLIFESIAVLMSALILYVRFLRMKDSERICALCALLCAGKAASVPNISNSALFMPLCARQFNVINCALLCAAFALLKIALRCALDRTAEEQDKAFYAMI